MQMIQGDDKVYRLAMRIETSNEIGVAHTMVAELKDNVLDSMVRLFQPVGVEFKDIIATASDAAIEQVKKQQEEESAQAADASAPEAAVEVVDGAQAVVVGE